MPSRPQSQPIDYLGVFSVGLLLLAAVVTPEYERYKAEAGMLLPKLTGLAQLSSETMKK